MAPKFIVPILRGFIPARGFVLKMPDREEGQASGLDGAGFFFLFRRRFFGGGASAGSRTGYPGDFPFRRLSIRYSSAGIPGSHSG